MEILGLLRIHGVFAISTITEASKISSWTTFYSDSAESKRNSIDQSIRNSKGYDKRLTYNIIIWLLPNTEHQTLTELNTSILISLFFRFAWDIRLQLIYQIYSNVILRLYIVYIHWTNFACARDRMRIKLIMAN